MVFDKPIVVSRSQKSKADDLVFIKCFKSDPKNSPNAPKNSPKGPKKIAKDAPNVAELKLKDRAVLPKAELSVYIGRSQKSV